MMGSVKRSRIKIDHTKVIDGFGELAGRHTYEPREVRCGLCGKPFVFSTKAQKYVHEVRGVPYKRADSGAAYCATCLPRRVARNRAVRNEAAIAAAYVRALSAMEAAPDEVEAIFAVLEAAVAGLSRDLGERDDLLHPRRHRAAAGHGDDALGPESAFAQAACGRHHRALAFRLRPQLFPGQRA